MPSFNKLALLFIFVVVLSLVGVTFNSANAAQDVFSWETVTLNEMSLISGESQKPQDFNPNSRVAFVTNRDGNAEIYVMNLDGSNPVNLTNNSAYDSAPDWSPDGSQIAFESSRSGKREIWLLNVADGSVQQLTFTSGEEISIQPSWSPDGTRIVFSRSSVSPIEYHHNFELFIVYVATGNISQVTDHPDDNQYINAFEPDWSPVSEQIVYSQNKFGSPQSFDYLYIVNSDGTGDQELIEDAGINGLHPSWSPDGTKIVFRIEVDFVGTKDLYILSVADLLVTRISSQLQEYDPFWGEDGKIYYANGSAGINNLDIAVANEDGSNVTNLTNDSTIVDRDPAVFICSSVFEDDSDGDGLWDEWEMNGVDTDCDGDIEVDLPAMGADPNVKDVFVEINYMDKPGPGRPEQEAINLVIKAFLQAPEKIVLHVDNGPNSIMIPSLDENGEVFGELWGNFSDTHIIPYKQFIGSDQHPNDETETRIAFGTDAIWLFSQSFHSDQRENIFHFAFWVDRIAVWEDNSGLKICKSGVGAGLKEDNPFSNMFIVSLGGWGGNQPCDANTPGFGTIHEKAGTFMHELGHDLGLDHGAPTGFEQFNVNNKPHHLSVMNYSYQKGIHHLEDGLVLDYARIQLFPLDETVLNEEGGIPGIDYAIRYSCAQDSFFWDYSPSSINWDCDSNQNEPSVATDINNTNGTLELLTMTTEWDKLVFNGGNIGQFGTGSNQGEEFSYIIEMSHEQSLELVYPYNVFVDGCNFNLVSEGQAITCQINITNFGTEDDAYNISATSSQGWSNLSAVPENLSIPANDTVSFDISINVPSNLPFESVEDILKITVESLNSNVFDIATIHTRYQIYRISLPLIVK